jgi:hypothetical protein
MAVPANETSFSTRLYADSERTLPDSDAEVITALESYGVAFKKLRNPAAIAVRLDLLAGVLWAHCHIKDLSPALADISTDQQRRLAAALRLDYDNDSKHAYWPDMVSRKILANALPGSTPLKRKAPDGALDGQIVKPGPYGAPAQPPQPGPPDSGSLLQLPPAAKASKPSKPAKRGAHRRARDSGDDSATSGSDEHASDDEAVVYEPGDSSSGLARMPSDLGSGPAFASLVASICALKWVPTHTFRSADVPAELRNSLWRAARWEPKHLERYDKMVARQNKPGRRNDRREDPSMVACPHRLCFAWSGDDGLRLNADHLAMVCACESMSDWAGTAGKKFDGSARPRGVRGTAAGADQFGQLLVSVCFRVPSACVIPYPRG